MSIPSNSRKVLINAVIHSGSANNRDNANIKFGTLLSSGIGYQYLSFRPYRQDAYNSNSQMFELDIEKDTNLYVESDIADSSSNFTLFAVVIAWK